MFCSKARSHSPFVIKDMKIILESGSPDCFLGSSVQGKLMVSVDNPQKYHSITVGLWGGAEVEWEEKGDIHRNLIVYVNEQETVWKVENPSTGGLPYGEHYYPFSFQLPYDTPPSSEHGHVRYIVKARIVEDFSRSKCTFCYHLNVRDPNDILSQYREPVMVEKSKSLKFLGLNLVCVSAKVRVPRTGFSPKEVVPVHISVDNQSLRHVRVVLSVQRVETFTSVDGMKKVVTTYISTPDGASNRPRVGTFQNSVSLRNCLCISVEYLLVVELHIPMSQNLQLQIPLVFAHDHSATVVPLGVQPQPSSPPPQPPWTPPEPLQTTPEPLQAPPPPPPQPPQHAYT